MAGKTGLGKSTTAVERIGVDGMEHFKTDPAKLAPMFFRSKQGVTDLMELTGGDKALVAGTAMQYAAQQIQGKGAKQVSTWLTKNKDWVDAVPGLAGRVEQYAAQVDKITRVGGKLESSAAALPKTGDAVVKSASERADSILKEALGRNQQGMTRNLASQKQVLDSGATKAGQVMADAQFRADSIIKDKSPIKAMQDLIEKGTPSQYLQVAKYMGNSPEGRKAVEGVARNILADPKKGAANVSDTWHAQLKPLMQQSDLMSKGAIASLDKQILAVEKAAGMTPKSKAEKIRGLVASMIGVGAGQAGIKVSSLLSGGESGQPNPR